MKFNDIPWKKIGLFAGGVLSIILMIFKKFESFSIPTIIPHFISDKLYNFDMNILGHKTRVDLAEIDFYKGMINVYKKFAN